MTILTERKCRLVIETKKLVVYRPKTLAFLSKKKLQTKLLQSIKSLSPLVCRGVVKKVGITERGVRRGERGRNSVGQIETEREG